jgi:FkbM family methyltransferase
MSIKFINDISEYLNTFPTFVDDLLNLLYSEIYSNKEDHILVDVGANEGMIVEVLLKHVNSSTGKIIAIDAHPRWHDLFMFNDHPDIAAYNIGCYSIATEKAFIDTDECSGDGFIGIPPRTKEFLKFGANLFRKHKIKCDTLDNILKPYADKKLTFLKIDAESCDFEVMLGAQTTIKKDRPFILFEFSGQIFEMAHSHSRIDFFEFFDVNNYSLYSIINGKPKDFIVDNWDKFTPELHDILAVPNEFNYVV